MDEKSKIEKKIDNLVNAIGITDAEKKKEASEKLQEIIASYRASEPVPVQTAADNQSTAIVPIKREELQKITGCSDKLLARYEKEGIRPYELIEMSQVAATYRTNLSSVKNNLLDAGVAIEDMDAILEARDSLDFSKHVSDKKSYAPTINKLVKMYHVLNDDIEEFKQIIIAATEYQGLAIRSAKYDAEKIHPNAFLNRILNVYLNEGQRDVQLTMDLLEAETKNTKKAECNQHDLAEADDRDNEADRLADFEDIDEAQ